MALPKITDVFIAGGLPTVTYVPRSEHRLEEEIRNYLDARYKVLSISGPTKSGKTVLVKKIIPRNERVWIPGGQVSSIDDLWDEVLNQLGGQTTIGSSKATGSGSESNAEASVSVKPAGIGAESKIGRRTSSSDGRNTQGSRTMSKAVVAINRLLAEKLPLIIDDFHYIPRAVQASIIRSFKEPVFEGLPVIFISVPHRAFDSVRVEKEMTGRVQQLPIPDWSEVELRKIPESGFDVLNSTCDPAIIDRIVKESFQSPHLMQDFCLALGREVQFDEKTRIVIPKPKSWETFFKQRATDTAKTAFDRLAQGPRQRTSRVDRVLWNGKKCDIYTAVLLAIAYTGPKGTLSYEDMRAGLNAVLRDHTPQAHEVTRVLEKMSEIARKDIEGEPVVDWDKEFSKLHVSDPFFAYYLRWGVELPRKV